MTERIAVVIVAFLTLVSCAAEPEREAPSTNPEVRVVVLTRFEGVTLYRIEADGKYIYVARTGEASGEALGTTARWEEQVCNPCGKDATCCDSEERETTVVAAHLKQQPGQ